MERRRALASIGLGFALSACALAEPPPAASQAAVKAARADTCDPTPTGVETTDYALHFRAEGLPDPQYNGKPAKIQVHRVQPIYAHGKCASVPNRVVVMIHGRTTPARAVFDLRHENGGELSYQEALARAGIDTFAPDLLGYGRSTRFGLDDPCNASRPDDTTHLAFIFPLDQQGRSPFDALGQPQATLVANPLAGGRCAHSSSLRFGTTDLWVRDVDRAIDDAIERGQPADGKVTLLGYSLGGQRIGRALDPERYDIHEKVNKAIFGASLFIGPFGAKVPRDEPCDARERPCDPNEPTATFTSFPLALNGFSTLPISPPSRETACPGRLLPGTEDEFWEQQLAVDEIGSQWGGSVPGEPTGLQRSPTSFTYGFNEDVAALFTLPTLVVQGLDDNGLTPGVPGHKHSCALYNALPASLENKVLVQVDCATHVFIIEGCTGDPLPERCTGHAGVTPYGGSEGAGWAGAHATFAAAAIEFIKDGTFTVPGQAPATSGKFLVNSSGVASVQGANGTLPTCP